MALQPVGARVQPSAIAPAVVSNPLADVPSPVDLVEQQPASAAAPVSTKPAPQPKRPFLEGRDGFVAFNTAGEVSGQLPGVTVRDQDAPHSRLDPLFDLVSPAVAGVPVTFSAAGQELPDASSTSVKGTTPLSAAATQAALQGVDPRRGGLVDLNVEGPGAPSDSVRMLALPSDYDGPIWISDIDDSIRGTKDHDLIAGKVQPPLPGIPSLYGAIAQRGVPIIYLSAGSSRLHLDNQAFLKQLPPGILLDRSDMTLKDLDPSDKFQTQSQGDYKAAVLAQLKATYPKAHFMGLGDDKFGDADAYTEEGVTAYIHDVKPDHQNIPANFSGTLTPDYNPTFQARVLSDVDTAIQRSQTFHPAPPPASEPTDYYVAKQ